MKTKSSFKKGDRVCFAKKMSLHFFDPERGMGIIDVSPNIYAFISGDSGIGGFVEITLAVDRQAFCISVPVNDLKPDGIRVGDMVVSCRELRLRTPSGKLLPGKYKGLTGIVEKRTDDGSMEVAFEYGSRFCAKATVREKSLKRV